MADLNKFNVTVTFTVGIQSTSNNKKEVKKEVQEYLNAMLPDASIPLSKIEVKRL